MGMAKPTKQPGTSVEQPTLLDIIRAELRDLVATSRRYREIIGTAKTSTKKQTYERKLGKNNKKIMRMLLAAEKYKDPGDTSGQPST